MSAAGRFLASATDFLGLWSTSIVSNAWCFSSGSHRCVRQAWTGNNRRHSDREERDSFLSNFVPQGACLWFLSSRLYDQHSFDPLPLLPPKDPNRIYQETGISPAQQNLLIILFNCRALYLDGSPVQEIQALVAGELVWCKGNERELCGGEGDNQ